MGRERHAGIERRNDSTARGRTKPPIQRAEARARGVAGPAPQQAPFGPSLASPGDILALQRTIGNAAVNQLLRQHALAAPARRGAAPAPSGLAVQRRAEDEEETVQAMPASAMPPVQRQEGDDGGEEGMVQAMPAAQRLHAASAPATGDQEDLGARIRAAAGRGSALDGGVQRTLEAGLGAGLSGVRVHTGGEADTLARSVQAVAFTTGPDIFFRSGAYNPSTPAGLHLLAHEAAHTVQQAQGPVSGTPHPGGVSISDPGDSFERAAEASAARVTAGVTAQPAQRTAADPAPLQGWAGTSTSATRATPIQRVWDLRRPNWSDTQRIKTVTSGQPVLFVEDGAGDTMVVKAEDTPIGMTQLTAGLHRQIHGETVVRTQDVTRDKDTILALIDRKRLTQDGSWSALAANLGSHPRFGDAFKKKYAGLSPRQQAREEQKEKFDDARMVHAMGFAQGKTAGQLSAANAPTGYQGMRQLLMDATYLKKMGMVTAADYFTENGDRFGTNLGNWLTAANGAITLIDNLDSSVKRMWSSTDTDDGVLGPTYYLDKLRQSELGGTASELVRDMAGAMAREGDTTIDSWMDEEVEQGGARKRFIATNLYHGLKQGRDRIIALYAPKNRFLLGTGLRGANKQARERTKVGATAAEARDYFAGAITNTDPKMAYWERIKARARWLKAH